LCGIAGFTHSKKTDPSLIRSSVASITHRGPDQQGCFESELVSLGAVRLKIIDLEGGEQPMQSSDGNTTIVFNGEIYIHVELRHELERRGRHFRSRCDTEVVLQGFLEWDVEVFKHLRGMFAVALWTESQHRLVLARDRVGIKPLYIRRRGDDLYFGSELKTFFAHPDLDRRLDPIGLNYFLSLNYIPGTHTLVEGIEKLLPGHWLEWRDGAIQTTPYWNATWSPRSITLDQAKEELDHLLRSSVREHLVSDVPLGLWASGGLDSSAVLHYAAQESGDRLKTFSVSFRGKPFDESPWFREVARTYNTDHHEFDLNPEVNLLDTIEQLPYYSDEPSADAGALPVWFLSKMTRQHVTVALSGEGADELFGGYQTYLADRYAHYVRMMPRWTRLSTLRLLGYWPASDNKISLEYKIKRMLGGSLLPPEQAHLFWNGTFCAMARRRLLTDAAYRDNKPLVTDSAEGRGHLNQFLYLDQHNYLVDDILNKCDRMSMAHSLEVRPPFLDHRIVEFAARLPESLKVHGSSLKYVLRELMKNKLPASVIHRRKEGFDIPAHAWFRTCLKPLLLDTVSESAVRNSGLFEWTSVQRIMNQHFERRANFGYHLWGLLTLFLWINRWGIQAQPQVSSRSEALAETSVTT
jgi:asparagine synthase (glutamine-hydrolysing)